MPRKRENKRTLEQRVAAMSISSESRTSLSQASSSSQVDARQNLSWLENLIRNRDSFDAIVTKHIFEKLKKSGVAKNDIVDILFETGCPLDFTLLMEDADVTRMILERKTKISKNESCLLIELAMRSSYLGNIKVLVRYGPGAADRSEMFSARMFDMINGPKANLESAKRYILQLMAADVIDVYSFKFLERTFEMGTSEAIRMLLDCKIDILMKIKHGEDVLQHIFGNKNVDVVGLLRGRRVDVYGKCGGMAALHFATLIKSDTNVRILLNAGANPNVRDCNGMTPLFAFGDRKCIELLLQNGADVQSIADNGYTILDMIFHPDLLGVLLAHIALIEAQGTTIKMEIRNKIAFKPSFKVFYEKCRKQIERIGKLRIHDDFTLLTTLIGKPEAISRFVNHQDIVEELINECRSLQIHSYYLTIMERNIKQAFAVWVLRFKAVKVLLPIFEEFQFDEVLVGKIVNYLTFKELLLLV